jgi:hypothetical protein
MHSSHVPINQGQITTPGIVMNLILGTFTRGIIPLANTVPKRQTAALKRTRLVHGQCHDDATIYLTSSIHMLRMYVERGTRIINIE